MKTIRGPLLNPQPGGRVNYFANGILQWDEQGILIAVGDGSTIPSGPDDRRSLGLILPPFLDCHIHPPQWPIRGKFCDGIPDHAAGGRLLAGLQQNVFPCETRWADRSAAETVLEQFQKDTLSHGVVGGSTYLTVHTAAAEMAFEKLSPLWSIGLVLMNMNCPLALRTDLATLDEVVEAMSREHGRRLILTDRFAVATNSSLRRRAAQLAKQFGLRMQTHLNEQIAEKRFVEKELYPDAGSYTDVYEQDGLLGHDAILAHCIQMSGEEFDLVARRGSAIAHCPTSNALLGSGIMPLDEVVQRGISYAICTDVGASPTTSILSEMAQFLKVHAGRSRHATPSEALYRTTLGAAEIMGLGAQLGTFAVGRPASFIEVAAELSTNSSSDPDEVILQGLLNLGPEEWRNQQTNPDFENAFAALARGSLEPGHELNWITRNVYETSTKTAEKVQRVTVQGSVMYERNKTNARTGA